MIPLHHVNIMNNRTKEALMVKKTMTRLERSQKDLVLFLEELLEESMWMENRANQQNAQLKKELMAVQRTLSAKNAYIAVLRQELKKS